MWRRRGETWPCGWWMLSSDGGMDTTGSTSAGGGGRTARAGGMCANESRRGGAMPRNDIISGGAPPGRLGNSSPPETGAGGLCVRTTRNETSTLQPYRYNTTPLTNNVMILLLEQAACKTKQLNKKTKQSRSKNDTA